MGTEPLRLLFVVTGKDGNSASEVDIIAVHGLSPCSVPDCEHAFNTWRKPPGEKGHLWLQEDLPEYNPKARIFLYEYSSKIAYEGTKGLFFDKANDLLEDLYLERTAVSKFLSTSTAWSWGPFGRATLVNAHANPRYSLIRNSTYGLVFFGAPHEGGEAIGAVAAKIGRSLGLQPKDDIFETLKDGSIFADTLKESWRHQLESHQIVSFWEGIGDVVSRESATFGLSGSRENIVRLDADHRDLCRFDYSMHDQDNSKLVRGNIQALYKGAIRHSEFISQLSPVAEKGEDRFVALRSPNVAGGTSLFAESRAR
ncbi:MAG: hypothetical protein FRX48_07796 [Lasallia pustulata]|uniref:Uncharacterized protein n=1 Tax=Lasallia pustulata TaxID=136370 RepID=A0A5M8PIW6_9LECA|nr:MAG: hypothetical protein FRX48_07796 [Lasallia pustulata]